MIRHLITLVSMLSLLLCVALCAQWVRSYWWSDCYLKQVHDSERVGAWTGNRLLHVESVKLYSDASARSFHWFREPGFQTEEQYSNGLATTDLLRPGWKTLPGDHEKGWDITGLGFRIAAFDQPSAAPFQRYWVQVAPLWFLAAAAAMFPAIVIAGRRRAARRLRRAAQGRCVICGYDTRATPGRCPECGARPASS